MMRATVQETVYGSFSLLFELKLSAGSYMLL